MRKTNKTSLMFKTMSTLIIFSVLILLFFYLFQILFSNYYYEVSKVKQVENISSNLESNLNSIEDYLRQASIENDVCIQYIDSGTLIYNEGNKGCLLENNNSKIRELKENMFSSEKDVVFYKINNPLYNTKTLLYGKRLSNGSYVFINSQLESLDKTYIVLRNQLLYLLIIVIIFAIVISYFISESITKPIVEITSKAKKMGEGKLNIEFENSNISEIDELSEALNYAKNELVKTDDYRKDLMANVGHDLKTPLTLIRSYAEMVRDITYKDAKKREENLNVIIDETERLNLLVSDILTLSKIESNADELDIEEYDMIVQIKEIISKFEILSVTEDYKFIYEGVDKALVKADKNKISQVVYNLLGNAVNYTGDDKTVYISVNENKKGYLVEIKDTGKGIDSKTIKYIWDRYYKTEKNHRRSKVGTGLGLSIVKGILEKHGFKYGVESEIDKGTKFYFTVNK